MNHLSRQSKRPHELRLRQCLVTSLTLVESMPLWHYGLTQTQHSPFLEPETEPMLDDYQDAKSLRLLLIIKSRVLQLESSTGILTQFATQLIIEFWAWRYGRTRD